MTTEVKESCRRIVTFNAVEAQNYFRVGRACKIISTDGTNLTDEKIALVMQKAGIFLTSYRGSPRSSDVAHGYNTFQKFCREQSVEFSFVTSN